MAKKRRSAAQRRATAKLVAFNKRRRAGTRRKSNPRKRRKTRRATTTVRKRRTRRKTNVVRKRRRTTARRRATPVRRRRRASPVRRRRRRNQPKGFTVKGFMNRAQQGVIDSIGVLAGKATTRIVANLIPIPGKQTAMVNALVQIVAATVVGTGAGMFFSRDVARMVTAGGIVAPIETFAKGIPFIGPMLGDDYLELGEYGVGDSDPFLPVGDSDPFLPVGEYGVGDNEYAEEMVAAQMGEYPSY